MFERDLGVKDSVIKSCPQICFICGYCKKDTNGHPILDGAHVKDNAKNPSNDNAHNMILLCPNHHREYDRGVIDFDTKGIIHTFNPHDPENGKSMAYFPTYIPPGTIDYHNKTKFKGSLTIGEI